MDKYKYLIEERDRLHTAWQLRKIHLDQLCDLLVFLRETKLVEDATNSQEAALSHVDVGEMVDEVSNQLKKHEEFEKLLQVQDKNFEVLVASGNKLLNQNHFESAQIAQRLGEVQSKRKKVHQLCRAKRKHLVNGLLYAEFIRDVAETQAWIAEKEKKLGAMSKAEVTDLEDKIKILQKHQAFQAEVVANSGRIQEIKQNGETLIRKNHKASQDIADQLADLEHAWRRLNEEVNLKGKGLEEAQDILEFNTQLDKIESWIRDKEVMLQAGDTGKDYEHCQLLQRKLDDVDSDMKIDDTKIKMITALSNKLASQGYPNVRERGDNLIKKWHSLQKALNDYRQKLKAASDIHLFDRDVADTLDRIGEKCVVMESTEVGRNLPAVEALRRKQEALENEVSAVENKIMNTHQKDALYLSDKYPHATNHLEDTLMVLHEQMDKLSAAKAKRRDLLQKAHAQEKFLADAKQLEQWVLEHVKRMESQEKPNSVADAEVQLELHNELKAEIKGRDKAFQELIHYGKTCSEKDNPVIIKNVGKLEDLHKTIHKAWDDHKNNLTHSFDVQIFNEQANQLNNWLATKEAFLNNEDVGDTPRAVEALLRKHNDFETMLENQLGRVEELKTEAKRISADPTRNHEEVTNKLDTVLNRKDKLLAKTKQRKDMLEKSKSLQAFLRNVNDVETWLNQKLQTAADESYREPINLQNKIQKHATFEAEVIASGERIQNVVEVGKDLIAADHYAATEIGVRLDELENDWKHLLELSNLKRDRLNEAYQALLFNRSLEEFETWLTDVENQLRISSSENDLSSAGNALKRIVILENDIQQHAENCEIINEGAEQFKKGGHFLAEEIEEKVQSAITRYHQLKEPLQARKDQLELSTMLQQFTRDVGEELQWLNDREPIVASQELGNNLTAVQNLQKKNQILESELASRGTIIEKLVSRAEQLIRSGHPSEAIITDTINKLKGKLDQIKDLASIRRLRLQDSLEAQAVSYFCYYIRHSLITVLFAFSFTKMYRRQLLGLQKRDHYLPPKKSVKMKIQLDHYKGN